MKKVLNYLLFILSIIMFVLCVGIYVNLAIGIIKDVKYLERWEIVYYLMLSGVAWTFMMCVCVEFVSSQFKKVRDEKTNRKETRKNSKDHKTDK